MYSHWIVEYVDDQKVKGQVLIVASCHVVEIREIFARQFPKFNVTKYSEFRMTAVPIVLASHVNFTE